MSTLPRARIVKAAEVEGVRPVNMANTAATPTQVPRGRLLTRQVHDAEGEAREILHRAKADAQRVIERGRAAAEAAREAGHAAGHAEARREWEAGLSALAHAQRRVEAESEDRVVTLAQLLAERLIGKELELSPDTVSALAREVLEQARGAAELKLVSHPDDAAALERWKETTRLSVTLGVDPSLSRGSLRLETDVGTVNGDLHGRLERLGAPLRRSSGSR